MKAINLSERHLVSCSICSKVARVFTRIRSKNQGSLLHMLIRHQRLLQMLRGRRFRSEKKRCACSRTAAMTTLKSAHDASFHPCL